MSRRSMLAGLGFGVATAGALATPALFLDRGPGSGARDGRSASLAHAGMDEWRRHIGTGFALAGGTVARLARVVPLGPLGPRPAGVRDRAFMAVFEAAAGTLPAGDGILDVRHAGAGDLKIHFSAIDDRRGGRRLLAVFA